MEENADTVMAQVGTVDASLPNSREPHRILAEFIRDHLDEVAAKAFVAYRAEYPHSRAADLSQDASERWTKWVVLDIANQIEAGKPDPYWFQRNNGGDMVLQCDAEFKPLAIAVEMLFFYGRVVAPMIWHHYLGNAKAISVLNDALERFIQAAVRANMETFLGDLDQHGAVQKTWRFFLDGSSDSRDAAAPVGRRWEESPAGEQAENRAAVREDGPLLQLTEREAQIARLVAEGETNKAIAAALGLSLGTVKNHLSRIYEKLGVTSRTGLAMQMAALARS